MEDILESLFRGEKMNLLSKDEFKNIEKLLRKYHNVQNGEKIGDIEFDKYFESIEEMKLFFADSSYKDFMQDFYFDREVYRHRYPTNSSMLRYMKDKLAYEQTRVYQIRRDIVYKAAMCFNKNGVKFDKMI